MFSKIIFVLATVCVVNSSALSVNLLDDDSETEVASNPKGCNVQACDQLCRRLKFPGGVCVNDRCKCDNFLNAEDAVSERTLSVLEDSVLQTDDSGAQVAVIPGCNLKLCDIWCRGLNKTSGACVDGGCKCAEPIIAEDDMNDPAEFLVPDSCNIRACGQQCFRLGFPGGACVNGLCKCDHFLHTEDAVSESNIEDSIPSRACNNQKCHQLCRKRKFRGGSCVGANCYCHKFLSLLEDTMPDPAESVPLSSCNSIACDDQCRRTGSHSGVCINGQCKCDYFLNTEDTVTGNNLSNSEDYISSRRCTYQACFERCINLQYPGGSCVGGRCRCSNFFGTEDAVDEYSEVTPRRVCKITKCNRKCTQRGYDGATCVDSRCKCYKNLQEKGQVSETSLPLSELSEGQTERACNIQACEQLCRRLKFPGGTCVNGRCKCDNFYGTEDDASQLNDATSDENEESDVILRTTEEVLVVPSPSACNMSLTCNEMCHLLNYAGGWCRSGQCECY